MKRILRYASGIGLVLLGIIGLILPIMPGWIFLVPGLMILSEEIPWLDRFLKRWITWGKQKLEREKNPDQNKDSDSPPPVV